VLLLAGAAVILLIAAQLTAVMAVGTAIAAYAATLIVQWGVLRARLGTKTDVEPKIQLRAWLKVASSFLWISIAVLIFLQAGVVVVGIFLTPEDVAIYSAAAATAGFVNLPVFATVALGAPKFAALHAQHCRPELQSLFTNIVRWTLGPSVAIALVFGIFGAMVLRLFGPGFEHGYPVLLILTLGMLSGAFVGPVAHLLTMTGHQPITARVQMTCAVLAVVLGFVLTPLWGIVGTAAGFAVATLLMNACLAIFVVRKLDIVPGLLMVASAARPARTPDPHE
jgi:O-antigen/teichoic acid export membrane protein